MPPKKGQTKKAVDYTKELWKAISLLYSEDPLEERIERLTDINMRLSAGHHYDTYNETTSMTDKAPDVNRKDTAGNNALMLFAKERAFDKDSVNAYYMKHNAWDKDDILDITDDICSSMIHMYNGRHKSSYIAEKNKAGKTAVDIAIEAGNFPVIEGIFSDLHDIRGQYADVLEAGYNKLKYTLPVNYSEQFRFLVEDAKKIAANANKAASRPSRIRNALAKAGYKPGSEEYSEMFQSMREHYSSMDDQELASEYIDTYNEPVKVRSSDSFAEKAMKEILVDYFMTLPEEKISRASAERVVSNALNIIIALYEKRHDEKDLVNRTLDKLRSDGKSDQEILMSLQGASDITQEEFEGWT